MHVKFNPTGTHIRNGLLVVRLDLYPDPVDKTYAGHCIDKFDREPTEEELADPEKLAAVPTHKELNPCLCHFIRVGEDITPAGLEALVRQIFDSETLQELDDTLVDIGLPEKRALLSQIMRSRGGAVQLVTVEKHDLVAVISSRLDDFEVML